MGEARDRLAETLKAMSLKRSLDDMESAPGLERCSHQLAGSGMACGLPADRWFEACGQPRARCRIHAPAEIPERVEGVQEISWEDAQLLEVHGS